MDVTQLCLALTLFYAVQILVAIGLPVCGERQCRRYYIGVLCLCLIGTGIVARQLSESRSMDAVLLAVVLEPDPKSILVAGAATALGLLVASSVVTSRIRGVLAVAAMVCGLVFPGIAGLLLAWDQRFDISRIQPQAVEEGWVISEVVRTEQPPVRLAYDALKQRLFYCSYSTGLNGVYGGAIYSIDAHVDEAAVTQIAASGPLLYRPFGLAVHAGELYVSRAGHGASARDGVVSFHNLGAVTKLSDFDGDGIYEFSHDVIQQIPAARAPDTMHQNNGIAFDEDGFLYVAVGSSDDRSVDEHEWAGTILRHDLHTGETEVWARGLRNPFGLASAASGSLFVTDNDCAEDPGDELNFVTRGTHCGHPYVLADTADADGFAPPVDVGKRGNYCGVAVTQDEGTDEWHVFVCDRLANVVWHLTVAIAEDGVEVMRRVPFARVPSPVDVVAAANGELFVASIGKQRIYRLSRK